MLTTDNTMQRAERALEYWEEGSMWARLIERDIDENDLESLRFHLDESDAEKNIQENFSIDFERRLLDGQPIGISTEDWPIVQMPEGFGDV